MPAYFDSGFCVRKPSWHGEELLLDDYPTDWNDARAKAGLLWEPSVVPAYRRLAPMACPMCGVEPGALHGEECIDFGLRNPDEASYIEAENQRLVVRSDTGAVLGGVSDRFELISHEEMGRILEALAEVGGTSLKFETGGSCKGGAQVWAVLYLDEPYSVAGDDSQTFPFLSILNAHDGSGACKVVRNQVRVVCWNTYQAASMEGNASGLQYVFRHTSGAKAKVEDMIGDAQRALDGLRTEAEAWQVLGTELAGLPVDEVKLNHFLSEFIPAPEADIVSPRVANNIEKARTMFRSIYLDSPTTEGHRGSGLGLLDASVEYLDHVRGHRSSDTLVTRTILRSEPLKAKALEIIRRTCV